MPRFLTPENQLKRCWEITSCVSYANVIGLYFLCLDCQQFGTPIQDAALRTKGSGKVQPPSAGDDRIPAHRPSSTPAAGSEAANNGKTYPIPIQGQTQAKVQPQIDSRLT